MHVFRCDMEKEIILLFDTLFMTLQPFDTLIFRGRNDKQISPCYQSNEFQYHQFLSRVSSLLPTFIVKKIIKNQIIYKSLSIKQKYYIFIYSKTNICLSIYFLRFSYLSLSIKYHFTWLSPNLKT